MEGARERGEGEGRGGANSAVVSLPGYTAAQLAPDSVQRLLRGEGMEGARERGEGEGRGGGGKGRGGRRTAYSGCGEGRERGEGEGRGGANSEGMGSEGGCGEKVSPCRPTCH